MCINRQSQLASVGDAERAMMLTQGLRNNGDLDIADPGLEGFVNVPRPLSLPFT